jgi:hypothetical protein
MWWHTVTQGRGSEGETGERSEEPVLFTLPRNTVYQALLPLMRTTRLPVVDWTDAPADLNGLVRFAERRNLVSARVPSHFKRSLQFFNNLFFQSYIFNNSLLFLLWNDVMSVRKAVSIRHTVISKRKGRRIWIVGRMILKLRKICPSDVFSTTNSTWNALGLKPRPSWQEALTIHPTLGTAIIFNSSSYKNFQ